MRKSLFLCFGLLPFLAAGRWMRQAHGLQRECSSKNCAVRMRWAKVGPSLEPLGQRSYLAGRLTNILAISSCG